MRSLPYFVFNSGGRALCLRLEYFWIAWNWLDSQKFYSSAIRKSPSQSRSLRLQPPESRDGGLIRKTTNGLQARRRTKVQTARRCFCKEANRSCISLDQFSMLEHRGRTLHVGFRSVWRLRQAKADWSSKIAEKRRKNKGKKCIVRGNFCCDLRFEPQCLLLGIWILQRGQGQWILIAYYQDSKTDFKVVRQGQRYCCWWRIRYRYAKISRCCRGRRHNPRPRCCAKRT